MTSLRFAIRQLSASPGFTAVAVITLAAGIGLNTAMFGVLNTFVLRPLPVNEPERVFRLDRVTAQEPEGFHRGPNYLEIERRTREVAELTGFTHWGYTISEPGRPARNVECLRISARFFDVLRIQPALGRAFRPDEDAEGRNNVIILSDGFWRSRYNADPNVVGRTVRVDRQPVEIVGVLPESAEVRPLFGVVDVYRPLGLTDEERSFRSETLFQVLGRYRSGVTAAEAQARFEVVAGQLAADRPQENRGLALRGTPIQSTVRNNDSTTIMLLLVGLSGFVLLIACANLANLLMVKAATRSREFAMCAALGASTGQLVRPLAIESLLLAALGGVSSWLLSVWISDWLARQLSGDGPPLVFPLDWRVLAFGNLGAVITAVLVGVAPAWVVSRINANEVLKSSARGATSGSSHTRFRTALIVTQVALTLVLLAGASAFGYGVWHLLTRDSGWDPAPLLTGRLLLAGHDDERERLVFFRRLQERLAALPGVRTASVDVDCRSTDSSPASART